MLLHKYYLHQYTTFQYLNYLIYNIFLSDICSKEKYIQKKRLFSYTICLRKFGTKMFRHYLAAKIVLPYNNTLSKVS